MGKFRVETENGEFFVDGTPVVDGGMLSFEREGRVVACFAPGHWVGFVEKKACE